MNKVKKNRNIVAAFLFFIFGLLFLVIFGRILMIQITGEVKGTELTAQAAERYLMTESLEASRGSILDRNGEIIAENSSSYTLIAILDEGVTLNEKNPRHVVDFKKTAAELAKHIDMPEDEIYDRLNINASLPEDKQRYQVEFGKQGKDLPLKVKKEIEALELPGIIFNKETKRFYPNGIFASHLIGYAQKTEVEKDDEKTEELVGQMGIEKSFNKDLQGENGLVQYDKDIWNYILPNAEKQVQEPKDGSNIRLTLDKKIQTFIEDAMTRADEEYKPKRLMTIVADAKTGAILGMSQRPTFHPSTREGIEDAWQNILVESAFEPGSTMKIFSLAAAIEEGKFNANEKYPSGQYLIDNKNSPIRDHNGGAGWGKITYLEGVQKSSNVAFAYLLEKMGTDTWREYMDEFKFGHKTGIALPNESTGNVLYNWPIEKVTSVFGQGTTVTALQLIQAMTAITNDGNMMKPYIVDKIIDPNTNKVTEFAPEMVGNPISSETAKEVSDILRTVVTDGTGKTYELDGYEVFGKTGTAQISESGYLQGDYLYSFLGAAPLDDPKVIVLVIADRPNLEAGETGSEPVSLIFNSVMQNSLQYMSIEPTNSKETEMVEIPDFTSLNVEQAIEFSEEHHLRLSISGNGEEIIRQVPEAGSQILEGSKVVIGVDGEPTIPDLTGMSKRDVLKVAQILNIDVNFSGEGYVVKQSLKQGATFSEDDELSVTLESQRNKKQKK